MSLILKVRRHVKPPARRLWVWRGYLSYRIESDTAFSDFGYNDWWKSHWSFTEAGLHRKLDREVNRLNGVYQSAPEKKGYDTKHDSAYAIEDVSQ